MGAARVFPVRLLRDVNSGKIRKMPMGLDGQDWRLYEGDESETLGCDNYGVIIPEGVVVIDLDTHKGVSREAVEAVLDCALDWDGALLQRTPNGGEHYGFLLPNGVAVRQGTDLLGLVGFDTRVAGKGWIASGSGYSHEHLFDPLTAMYERMLPELPSEACLRLGDGWVGVDAENGYSEAQGLLEAVSAQPLDNLTDEDVQVYLDRLPVSVVEEYDSWLRVGMALHHQYRGGDRGLDLWDAVSKQGANYSGREDLEYRWRGFGGRTGGTTFATVIKMAGGQVVVKTNRIEQLQQSATKIETMGQFEAFRSEWLKSGFASSPVYMNMVSKSLANSEWAKSNGIRQSNIERELRGIKKKAHGNSDAPEWMGGWVYIETTNEFHSTESHYSIKRDAFNAKFDRQPECKMAERHAADLALTEWDMPTAVDTIFWPGAGKFVEQDGLELVNTYRDIFDVIPTKEPNTQEEREIYDYCVGLLHQHMHFLIADEREQGLLLDWLSYVAQNPGHRVAWAPLIQGIQGSGKTFLHSLMSRCLGIYAKTLDATMISGRFTSWAHGSVLTTIEEIRISGHNRYEVLDRMKPFITNEVISIEEKGRDARVVPNFTNYLMLTNHKDAIPLEQGDRRYFVLYGRLQSEQQLYDELGGKEGAQRYFTELFNALRDHAWAFVHYMRTRVQGAEFEPLGRAPETDAKAELVALGIDPETELVEDLIARFECSVINDNVINVTLLNELAKRNNEQLPKDRALGRILSKMGYNKPAQNLVRFTSGRARFWYRHTTEDEAKEIVRTKTADAETEIMARQFEVI